MDARLLLIGAALALAAPAAAGDSLPAPLAHGFSASARMGASVQAPALWYYGPSYSLYYDLPPGGAAGTGPAYRPSHRSDPYYGRDFLERSFRGQRFDR